MSAFRQDSKTWTMPQVGALSPKSIARSLFSLSLAFLPDFSRTRLSVVTSFVRSKLLPFRCLLISAQVSAVRHIVIIIRCRSGLKAPHGITSTSDGCKTCGRLAEINSSLRREGVICRIQMVFFFWPKINWLNMNNFQVF